MNLPCSRRPWQDWRWKLFLTSENKTQGPLFLPILHGSVHSLISSSSDRWSSLRHTYPGTRYVFFVPR